MSKHVRFKRGVIIVYHKIQNVLNVHLNANYAQILYPQDVKNVKKAF